MFNENLIESSPAPRRHRHWPTFAAFAIQLAMGAGLVVIPLFYVGVLPQNVRLTTPITTAPVVHETVASAPSGGGGGGSPLPRQVILLASNDSQSILLPRTHEEPSSDGPPTIMGGNDRRFPIGIGDGPGPPNNVLLFNQKKPTTPSTLDKNLLFVHILHDNPTIT